MIFSLKRKLPAYGNKEMIERINDQIHDKLDRQILKYRLIHNCTLLRTADLVHQPLSTVRDRYYRCLDILFPRK